MSGYQYVYRFCGVYSINSYTGVNSAGMLYYSLFYIFAPNQDGVKKITIFVFQLLLFSVLFSCRSSRPVVSTAGFNGSVSSYIQQYKDLAISEMRRTGVPASITLAQGMVESDYGRSTLAREANNHFGIKCHNDWKGATVRYHDDRRNECFRKYRNAEDSFRDHSDFLRTGSRYSSLFSLNQTDYKSWARELKKAGYATNPDYANMLIRKIEENALYNFDRGQTAAVTSVKPTVPEPVKDTAKPVTVTSSSVAASPPEEQGSFGSIMDRGSRVMENNRIRYIIAQEGDTREKIEKEYQLLKFELARYNDLPSNFVISPGQILYLQPKRDKAEVGKEFHTVTGGETLYQISQIYGISLNSLNEMNRIREGTNPAPGEKIWLRGLKPVN